MAEFDRETLRTLHNLQALSDQDLDAIAPYLQKREVDAGEVIFVEGDPGDAAYFVLSGRVSIVKTTPDGDEQLLVICGPGDVFGAVVLLDGGSYPATAEALRDSTLAVLLRSDYQNLRERVPSLSAALTMELGQRLRRAHRRLLSFSAQDSEGRLAELLLQLAAQQADTQGKGGSVASLAQLTIDAPPTHQEMANYIGSARETVSRTLSRWRELGWIESRPRRLTILDADALRRLM